MLTNTKWVKIITTTACISCLVACNGSDKKSKDTTAPEINLNGAQTLSINLGEAFVDPGATANDNVDGVVAVTVSGSVNSAVAGDYEITYRAEDNAGNSAQITRTVTVAPAATQSLLITVKDYFNGEIIENAIVSAHWLEDDIEYAVDATAAASGEYLAEIASNVNRISVFADADNYGEQSRIVLSGEQAITVFLQPTNAEPVFDAAAASVLTVDGVEIVALGANALVDDNDNPASGQITAEITIIDPSIDPALMPGDYQAQNQQTGDVASIESFGAINVTFADANGTALNLAQGQSASIQIPVAGNVNAPPATIPLYYFDESTGYWIEEGEANLTSLASGQLVYQGTVSHFTTWNADMISETVQIEGCVTSPDGSPLAGVTLFSQGLSYNGTAMTITDSNGNFSLSARNSANVLISSASTGVISRTLSVTTGVDTLVLESCLMTEEAGAVVTLTWGENPSDLDTHFSGPADATGSSDFHVYFGNRNVVVGDSVVFLDVDDTSSFGPEITTIGFPFDGIYTYAVHHYSGSGDIQSSPARVEVALNGETYIFNPPAGEPTLCWSVFDFEVVGGVATVRAASRWEEESFCVNGDTNNALYQQGNGGDAGEMLKPQRPTLLLDRVADKYYAGH